MSLKYPESYCLLLLVAACFFLSVSTVRAGDEGLAYKVIFRGIADKDLLSDIQSVSDAYNNADINIASSYLLEKMADADIETFLQLLKARGFYNASVRSEINTKNIPLELTYEFQTGDPFLLKSVKLEFSNDSGDDTPKLPSVPRLGLILGQSFSSQSVLDGQDILISIIRSRGFPFVKISRLDVIVDHQDQSVSVTFYIDTGPKAYFGLTTISGLSEVKETFVRGNVPWKEGDTFNGNLLEEARKNISETGVFASVRIIEGKEIDDRSRIPVTIAVTERKHKSVGVGVNYVTDKGPGVRISWENRNIFHKGERLSTYIEKSEYITASETSFRKPDFLINDQSLRLSLRISDERLEAYESKSIISSGYIDRELTDIFSIGAGVTIKSSTTKQLDSVDSYNLTSYPLYFSMDKTSDILDPVIGQRFSLQLTPYYRISDQRITFGKALMSYKRYIRISRKPLIVIAAGITASVLKGAPRDDIPADERLYAGGGGSIRGYPYQSVGPLSDGDPVGGKALFESSLEIRLRISERFGLAAFLDGGNAFEEKMFSEGQPLIWGTGIGFRYYTPVGPFRLDVGIPLDKREGIDDSYQVYISLGQAF